jgi:cytochrome oxidase Cu insertion factor (SCO1/SenC/PrrC family)
MQILSVKKSYSAALLFFFMFASTTLSAQTREAVDVHSLGPQVGDSVPDFQLPDQNGNTHTLDSIMGPNGAMLLFHRSADW